MSKVIKKILLQDTPRLVGEAPPDAARLAAGAAAETLERLAQAKYEEAAAKLRAAGEESQRLLAAAEARAQQRVAEAEVKAAERQEAAYNEGLTRGLAEGRDKGRREARCEMRQAIDEAAAKAERTVALAAEERKNSLLDAERQIVELALAVARRVLHEAFAAEPARVVELARAALQKVRDQNTIVVRVSSGDYEYVLKAKDELQRMAGKEDAVTIRVDETVERGGCVVESESGAADARLDTQLAALEQAVRERLP